MDWQPIATAPTDERVLLAGGDLHGFVRIGYRDRNGAFVTDEALAAMGDYPAREVSPTHWMPLPEPPR